jgi:hypothetical protein
MPQPRQGGRRKHRTSSKVYRIASAFRIQRLRAHRRTAAPPLTYNQRQSAGDLIYLLLIYSKSDQSDLSAKEKQLLHKLVTKEFK